MKFRSKTSECILLWDVVEVIKQCSRQDKLLSGFSVWEVCTSPKHLIFNFLFPLLLWLPGSSKSNVSPTSSKCTELLSRILCIILSLSVSSFPILYSKLTLI